MLAFEYLRIAESLQPRWLLLENVPGLLSSNRGRDLARLLDEVGAIGYGWAYRVINARYFGVPQRRRRVFICARRAETTDDSGDAARLALRALWEGSGGDSTPCWPPWAETTADAGGGAQEGGGHPIAFYYSGGGNDSPSTDGVSPTVKKGSSIDIGSPPAIAFSHTQGLNEQASGEVWPTLRKNGGGHAVSYRKSKRAQTDQDDESWVEADETNTLNAFDTGDTQATQLVAETASTLQRAGGERGQRIDAEAAAGGHLVAGVSATLTRHNLDSQSPQSEEQQRIITAVHQATTSVRRLTPLECERLMGWPDNWTAPEGVKASDSKRYAACGDGIVSWVAYWIGQRIQMIEAEA